MVAGLAVAAVAIPVGVANAQLAGFGPAVGLYASILPLVAYALFGTSRQLMYGPSSAAAALVAAAIAPLAAGDDALYLALAMALTFLTGVICIGASFLRLGAIADFLSRPILVGFLNGVGISIVLSQIGNLFGIHIAANGIIARTIEFASKLPLTHWPTLLVGIGSIGVLTLAPKFLKRLPAALVAMAAAALVVHWLDLEDAGVATIGPVLGGLPMPRLPTFPLDRLPVLIAEAAGLALVTFSTTMLAARSFASRNRYDVDADREIAALGAANIAAALSQSFVVNGTNARTAVGEAAGGRTQVTGLVSAAAVALVLFAFTQPLQYVPTVALAAILVMAGLSLLNWSELANIRRIDPREFWIAIIATVGVVLVGAMNAILVAVALALISFVRLASRPKVEILGQIAGLSGFHSLARHPEATTPSGLLLFRFNGPIIFFSASYFKREVQRAASAAGAGLKWLVIDLLPVNMVDATGIYAIQEVFDEMRARGIVVGAAARETEWADWAAERGLDEAMGRTRFFSTLQQAAQAFHDEVGEAAR